MKNKLNIYDYQDLKCNFHTHTARCKHAVGEEREYVEKAIEAGFQVLGFSDHAPYLFEDGHISRIRMFMDELEDYVKTVESLRQEYEKEIQIFTGLEIEYFPSAFEKTLSEIQKYPLDYLILGQHYFDEEVGKRYVGLEWTEEIWLETYVERVTTAIKTNEFLYVAHPDIINYTGSRSVYEKHMRRLARVLKEHNLPIEINVNGYRKKIQYPNPFFMEIAAKEGCDFIIGVDAHSPAELMDFESYDGCRGIAPTERLKWTGQQNKYVDGD